MSVRVQSFGECLRGAREEAALSIRAVHRALGEKPALSQLALWEKGVGAPKDPDLVRRLARIVKIDAVKLLALSGISVDLWRPAERASALSPELLESLGR